MLDKDDDDGEVAEDGGAVHRGTCIPIAAPKPFKGHARTTLPSPSQTKFVATKFLAKGSWLLRRTTVASANIEFKSKTY